MTGWKTIALTILIAASSSVLAEAAFEGTAQEQAACRPDVRRFCHAVKTGSGNGAFLSCLQANRQKLSKACTTVLKNHGVLSP
jgi:hypothetical protein